MEDLFIEMMGRFKENVEEEEMDFKSGIIIARKDVVGELKLVEIMKAMEGVRKSPEYMEALKNLMNIAKEELEVNLMRKFNSSLDIEVFGEQGTLRLILEQDNAFQQFIQDFKLSRFTSVKDVFQGTFFINDDFFCKDEVEIELEKKDGEIFLRVFYEDGASNRTKLDKALGIK